MSDLHEVFLEHADETHRAAAKTAGEMYGPQAADALMRIYEADRRGAMPMMANCFIDPSAALAEGVKVWHYARVLAEVELGAYVSIGGGTEVGRGSRIGAYSRIGANCFLPPDSFIGERVFVGPGVNFADDQYPFVHMDSDDPYTPAPPFVDDGAVIGLGVTVLPGVHIGKRAFVGAGALVLSHVPDDGAVFGVPAVPFTLSDKARRRIFGTRYPIDDVSRFSVGAEQVVGG